MNSFRGKFHSHKGLATGLVMALVVGIPLTVAVIHPGFPVSNVDLTSRDVWVTNGAQLLGGRLNRQINELNGSVVASSARFDVLQDGDSLFMHNPDSGRIESVSPATTQVTSAVDIPKQSAVAFGGTSLAIVSPAGDLWVIASVGDLHFNYVSTPPLAKLGAGGHAVVTASGAIIAVSKTQKKIYHFASLAAKPTVTAFPALGDFQLAAVGERAVVFDPSANTLITDEGVSFAVPGKALKLQQSSGPAPYAVLSTAGALVKIDLDSGAATTISAQLKAPAWDASQAAAPVSVDGCVHGAWSSSGQYLMACVGKTPVRHTIEKSTPGSSLEFRVNRSVVALNDLTNGNVWLPNENMRLVDNWADVTPPQVENSEEKGKEKSATQSFSDTLAQRTEVNRPPTAVDDNFGIRPGRTTILPVLDNDTDPDGDVLVITNVDPVDPSTGHLDYIDGNRALQFTPAPGFVGQVSLAYSIDDGRGGTAMARVSARVVPESSNQPPVSLRDGGVSVEASQTVSYNVLSNWRDPDGDDLYLVGASPKSADLVRFTPDGMITFTHATSEIGPKEVTFQVSDGHGASVQGTLIVDVKAAGTLSPVATPDFATAFTNESTVIDPLVNDLSPSGDQLKLVAIEAPGAGAVASFSSDTGEISFNSSAPGINYLKYTVQAGTFTTVGLVRIDVSDKPSDTSLPPIAVKDTAYLRGDEPTTVSVLTNDVSPSGKVLAVQSISVPPELIAKGLVVELLNSTLIRVTSPQALTNQVDFSYTISDGNKTASAGVTVVPVPALTKHQPPVAAADTATVRVGDVTTVDVLANDFHPDNSPMSLDPKLVTQPEAGLAFVSANTVRYQAPTTPGEYHVVYRVIDPYGESGTATVTFTVTGLDAKANRSPVPKPLIGRVLAGDSIRIDIPLNGIDPDGDSAQLLNFPNGPAFGSIVEQGPGYFIYQSSAAAAGTDTFSYEVYDAFGATGDGTIKIAVIPKPKSLANPTASPDSVSVRPGRIAQVDLTANDSDPQGAPITVSKKLIDVPAGISASVVKGHYLVVTAPETEQSFSLRYELTNDLGGKDVSYVLVKVTKDAPILPPTATDISILPKTIAGKATTTVDVFDNHAFNPSGVTEDMKVTIEGPNAGAAKLLEKNGQIQVTPGKTRQAIAYRVTNEKDVLSAMAFILVPAVVAKDFDQPPVIDPALPVQYVSMNETRTWKIADILKVPSGRPAYIPDRGSVIALQSNGASSYVDKDTLTFTPGTDYRGPASINFTVFDGSSPKDPKGLKANLRLNIVVGDPEFKDTPPTFTTPTIQVEVGEKTTIDLRASTGQPNPQILSEVTYSGLSSVEGLSTDLNGSALTVSTARDAKKGRNYTLPVTLRWNQFTVAGVVKVIVVGSSKPLPVTVADNFEAKRGDGALVTHPLVNDSNPYQTTGEKLVIVDAQVQNTANPATIGFTADTVTITPNPSLKDGRIEVVYTVQDATKDTDRQVNGTITLVVSDVPDPVAKPTSSSAIGGDQTATWKFIAPASNGKPITSYEVRTDPAVAVPTNCTAGVDCTIAGLVNGKPYTFSARAINERGPGPWSVASDPVTPYGTPAQPQPTLTTASKWAPAAITASWNSVGATGGTTSYTWTLSDGQTGKTTGTSVAFSKNEGTYTITVTASNDGGKSGPAGTSAALVIKKEPAPTAPQNVSTPAGGQSPGSMTWTWKAPANGTPDQAGDGLTYTWTVHPTNQTGTGTATSTPAIAASDAGGDYSLTVHAQNKSGTSADAQSGTTHFAAKKVDPPPFSIVLSQGGVAEHGHYAHLEVRNAQPSTQYVFRCTTEANGQEFGVIGGHNFTTGPDGQYSGTPGSHGTERADESSGPNSCYTSDRYYVTVDGVDAAHKQSNTIKG